MKKAKQFHSKPEKNTKRMTPTQAARFLEDYQNMIFGKDEKTKLISLRVPENILRSFKTQSEDRNIKYQSQIVRLMREWLSDKK